MEKIKSIELTGNKLSISDKEFGNLLKLLSKFNKLNNIALEFTNNYIRNISLLREVIDGNKH